MSALHHRPGTVNPARPSTRPVRPQRPKPIARPRLILAPAEGLPGLFSVTDAKGTAWYQFSPIGSAWGRAFSVEKMSTAELLPVYHVLIDPEHSTCECKGHLAHGHKTVCRHIEALTTFLAAGQLDTSAPATCSEVLLDMPEYDAAPDYLSEGHSSETPF